jgi:SAM-dependent methyltransferase
MEPLVAEASCPICGGPCPEPALYRYSVEQAAAHFCPPSRNEDRNRRLQQCIRRLWGSSECEILKCENCGFAFGHPFVGGDEEFYSILHEQREYPTWRWDYDIAMREAIEKSSGGKVLDVGAGVGMFLLALGNNWERYAVEGSETTRSDLEAKQIKVFRDLSESAQEHSGAFQVITLFQVLEHVADFAALLQRCRELLVAGGRLVVTVPDGDAMLRQERVTGCPDMPPNHVSKFTPASLERVLRQVGFECGREIPEPSSWRNLKANLHMRLGADAANPNSIAAQAYRIENRPLRIVALGLLAVPALLRMLPHGRQLLAGGAFAMVGIKTA